MTRWTILSLCLLTSACGGEQASEPDPAATAEPEPEPEAEPQVEPEPEPDMEHPRSRAYENPEDGLGTTPEGVGVAVGEPAPDAEVRTYEGDEIQLSSLWADGAVLLVFYRGGWCPYCNFQVHELAEAFPRFEERGVTPAMISVDRPEESARTRASWEIPFPVLSDQDLEAHRAYRVSNEVDAETLERLRGMGVDLETHSAREHHTIAIPAIFLIDEQGTIRWAHADHDYRTRPSAEQVLEATADL